MADPAQFALLTDDQCVGIAEMDSTHDEFLVLYAQAREADRTSFAARLKSLHDHTRTHFAFEEKLMSESGFPATSEHTSEHQRLLGELARFLERAEAGSQMMARAWLQQQVPEWFRSHLLSMDSALAAHLKKSEDPQYVRMRV